MKSESPVIIFNSSQGAIEETNSYKCFSTFNFKDFSEEHNESIGQLFFLNDAFLSPQENIIYRNQEDTGVVIIPITGALDYQDETCKEKRVKAGQLLITKMQKGRPYTLHNPFKKEWINYLQIGFTSHFFSQENAFTREHISFKKMNALVCLNLKTQDRLSVHIGIYQGRSEDYYKPTKKDAAVFVYIINGVFEVQGRLLEYREGLSLWNIKKIKFESLSNYAIILLLEIN